MFRKLAMIMLVFVFLLCASVSAQDWMPDENLRKAVREALGEPITKQAMESLTELYIQQRGVSNLTGLEFSINMHSLHISGNRVVDLTPIANLKIRELHAIACGIVDITQLSNMLTLEYLHLSYNKINDFKPLLNLKNLKELALLGNPVTELDIIDRHLDLQWSDWSETCMVPDIPIEERIANRPYPATFGIWSEILNQSEFRTKKQHNLIIQSPIFNLTWSRTKTDWGLAGDLTQAYIMHSELRKNNPNTLFLRPVQYFLVPSTSHPLWSDFYLRDDDGNPIIDGAELFGYTLENTVNQGKTVDFLLDFTIPELQDIIIKQVIGISKCGLYDGIMFDHWNEGRRLHNYHSNESEHNARTTILKRIREVVDDDFLIIVNTNWGKIPKWSQYINGAFMELDMGISVGYDRWQGYQTKNLIHFEDVLTWSEQNMRHPQINCLEGWGIATEAPDSRNNLRWMRLFTTMSLTHSDGYVIYTEGRSHSAYWYDFWDVDLGKPISNKSTLYKNKNGLFIREFDHGWAVYNRSGSEQTIRFESHVSGKASKFGGTEHTIADLDGEIYLKRNPADVNNDGIANILDLVLVANGLGTSEPDLNGDGVVNILDLVIVANAF